MHPSITSEIETSTFNVDKICLIIIFFISNQIMSFITVQLYSRCQLWVTVVDILSEAMNILILQCCVFFCVCLCTRERVEIMLQFQTLGVVSDSKMNLVGALGRSFFEFPNSFQKRREKPKKNLRKNGNFYAKQVFDQMDFFIWFVDKKILDDQKFKFLRSLSKTRKFANNFEVEKS
ncbi:Uncharacterized protein FWK35_00007464 [Aphis craccivora]|uniref:Uncharacterized protein n=3 Tax=Aphis craccivora TaxID=307492 RepID=A0A6G0ZNJ4_APHCR|nr:Uncharacterized protein FWK35_00007464 [Aphis craccivora]